ncbi:MAG: thioredoxin domain-containing protein [Microbacteriaceae bacterium]|nr:MAG: thioredoxin domain-containing protein [Microbacteriaceae bacterium]
MTNRLADAISPYLRAHAQNPVDWYPWGEDAFEEARRRDVPMFISIGYSTCHWCHVMARESFSDPELAAELNARFVGVKVDREEHPDVDAGYLAAASAFSQNLGWPLSIFATPEGRVFFAGTYFPPESRRGQSSFRQVLDAVSDAWTNRRDDVLQTATLVTDALASAAPAAASELPDAQALDAAAAGLAAHEDRLYGGFGAAPKFPIAPALGFLLRQPTGAPSALRTLAKMAASPLRDPIEGGFFRYATQRDWSVPHYERMLYDNAQLLRLYADAAGAAVAAGQPAAGAASAAPETYAANSAEEGDDNAFRGAAAGPPRADAGAPDSVAVADGIARFLLDVLRLPTGGFASAQDSESTVDGERVEGEYYLLDAAARSQQRPPALDEKVLTGWNGLVIGALAHAGALLDRPDWIRAARETADLLLVRHRGPEGALSRASLGERVSDASATLEDYGMLAGGLLDLALATGESRYAAAARDIVDSTITAAAAVAAVVQFTGAAAPFAAPGGADPVLVTRGLAITVDPSEGAYPSGLSATAAAAHRLFLLTGQRHYEDAAASAMRIVAGSALASPLSFGAALELMSGLAHDPIQLVVVTPGGQEPVRAGSAGVEPSAAESRPKPQSRPHHADTASEELAALARRAPSADVTAVVTDEQASAFARAGFELFEARIVVDGRATAYYCRDFVCRLPTTDAGELTTLLAG